jgi:hypothetical protein|tara:strand:- start:15414 stop:15905 length:492 start_codon:yes stop_codon:yes gene_type:complete
MTYLLFSKAFIRNIKKAAKSERKAGNGKQTENLNLIAKHSGYQAWNNLSKHLESTGIIPESLYRKVLKAVLITCPITADKFVLSELKDYLNSNFERLADYSMPNPHTDNGYSHPSIDVKTELEEAYLTIFGPETLSVMVNKLLESEEGWCLDDGDLILEYQMP